MLAPVRSDRVGRTCLSYRIRTNRVEPKNFRNSQIQRILPNTNNWKILVNVPADDADDTSALVKPNSGCQQFAENVKFAGMP